MQQHTLLTPIPAGGTRRGTWGSGGGDGFPLQPDPFRVYSFSTEILIACNLDHINQESFSIRSPPTWALFSKPILTSESKKVGVRLLKNQSPLATWSGCHCLLFTARPRADVITSYHSLIPLPVSLLLSWGAEMASGLRRPTVAFSQSLSSSLVHDIISHLFPCENVSWFSANPSSHVSFISLATFSPLANPCVLYQPIIFLPALTTLAIPWGTATTFVQVNAQVPRFSSPLLQSV